MEKRERDPKLEEIHDALVREGVARDPWALAQWIRQREKSLLKKLERRFKMKRKTRIKEPEDEDTEEEDEETKEAPCKEEGGIGRLRRRKKRRFEKEDEEPEDEEVEKEDEDEDDEDTEEEDETMGREGISYKKRRKKKRMRKQEEEPEDEEVEKEDEEPEDEEETEKGELGGVSPIESGEQSTTAGHTITPGKVIGGTQHILTPQSQIPGERMGKPEGRSSGVSPSDVTYSGKSAKSDLMKSPLFIELSGQMENLGKAVNDKLTAIEKSVNDRLENIKKTATKIEEFYKRPFFKAVAEEMGAEAVQKQSIKEQIEKGKVKFSAQ